MIPSTYIFLDEAGNLDFGPLGTRYFVLTSVRMRRPFPVVDALDAYKYDCLEFGLNTEYFHCSNDNRHVRAKVFELVSTYRDNLKIDCLVVEKSNKDQALQEAKRFYPEVVGRLLRGVLPLELAAGAKELIVITDTIPVTKKREAIEKGVKGVVAGILPRDVPYHIFHHASRSHYGLQLADYICWAVLGKWQRDNTAFYESFKESLRTEATW